MRTHQVEASLFITSARASLAKGIEGGRKDTKEVQYTKEQTSGEYKAQWALLTGWDGWNIEGRVRVWKRNCWGRWSNRSDDFNQHVGGRRNLSYRCWGGKNGVGISGFDGLHSSDFYPINSVCKTDQCGVVGDIGSIDFTVQQLL